MGRDDFKFLFDYTLEDLFYFLYYLKNLKEEYKDIKINLYFPFNREDEFQELIPILERQLYIDSALFIETALPIEKNVVIINEALLAPVMKLNLNKVRKYYSLLPKVRYMEYSSWLDFEEAVRDTIYISINFNSDPEYLNHLKLYETLKETHQNICFIGSEVWFLSYVRDNLHNKYKPEYIDYDHIVEIITLINRAKCFVGTSSIYLAISQALGVKEILLLSNNESVSSLVGTNTKGYNV